MVNYLNSFCPLLSSTTKPLYDLLKVDMAFNWSTVAEQAFIKTKYLILQAPCLAFYDHDKPVTLQVDAL